MLGNRLGYCAALIMTILMVGATSVNAQSLQTVADESLALQKVAGGFDKSSGFEFVEGGILVLEKEKGTIKYLSADFTSRKYNVLDLNVFNYEFDGGLIGITSSKVGNGTYVFLRVTENPDEDGGDQFEYGLGNRAYRYKWNGVELIDPILILDLPSAPSPFNSGGKILVGPDDQLYTIIGDLNREGKEQNIPDEDPSEYWLYDNKTESSAIIRTDFTGQPSADNPFTEEGFEKFYAYGIRNSFGLAFDPVTGNLWDSEKGPNLKMDELNLVKKGFNSGWKQIQGRVTDECCPAIGLELSQNPDNLHMITGAHYSEPKFVWTDSPSITAIAFLNSSALGPDYQNDLFVGDMQGNIHQFELDETRENIVSNRILVSGLGSISDIKTGLDGYLYAMTYADTIGYRVGSDSGGLYRIVPAGTPIPESREDVQIRADVAAITGILIIASAITGVVIYRKRKES